MTRKMLRLFAGGANRTGWGVTTVRPFRLDRGHPPRTQISDVHYNRGESYRLKGDHDRAIVDYTEAIRLNPDAHLNRRRAPCPPRTLARLDNWGVEFCRFMPDFSQGQPYRLVDLVSSANSCRCHCRSWSSGRPVVVALFDCRCRSRHAKGGSACVVVRSCLLRIRVEVPGQNLWLRIVCD